VIDRKDVLLPSPMNALDHNRSLLGDYGSYVLPVLNFRRIVLVRGSGSRN